MSRRSSARGKGKRDMIDVSENNVHLDYNQVLYVVVRERGEDGASGIVTGRYRFVKAVQKKDNKEDSSLFICFDVLDPNTSKKKLHIDPDFIFCDRRTRDVGRKIIEQLKVIDNIDFKTHRSSYYKAVTVLRKVLNEVNQKIVSELRKNVTISFDPTSSKRVRGKVLFHFFRKSENDRDGDGKFTVPMHGNLVSRKGHLHMPAYLLRVHISQINFSENVNCRPVFKPYAQFLSTCFQDKDTVGSILQMEQSCLLVPIVPWATEKIVEFNQLDNVGADVTYLSLEINQGRFGCAGKQHAVAAKKLFKEQKPELYQALIDEGHDGLEYENCVLLLGASPEIVLQESMLHNKRGAQLPVSLSIRLRFMKRMFLKRSTLGIGGANTDFCDYFLSVLPNIVTPGSSPDKKDSGKAMILDFLKLVQFDPREHEWRSFDLVLKAVDTFNTRTVLMSQKLSSIRIFARLLVKKNFRTDQVGYNILSDCINKVMVEQSIKNFGSEFANAFTKSTRLEKCVDIFQQFLRYKMKARNHVQLFVKITTDRIGKVLFDQSSNLHCLDIMKYHQLNSVKFIAKSKPKKISDVFCSHHVELQKRLVELEKLVGIQEKIEDYRNRENLFYHSVMDVKIRGDDEEEEEEEDGENITMRNTIKVSFDWYSGDAEATIQILGKSPSNGNFLLYDVIICDLPFEFESGKIDRVFTNILSGFPPQQFPNIFVFGKVSQLDKVELATKLVSGDSYLYHYGVWLKPNKNSNIGNPTNNQPLNVCEHWLYCNKKDGGVWNSADRKERMNIFIVNTVPPKSRFLVGGYTYYRYEKPQELYAEILSRIINTSRRNRVLSICCGTCPEISFFVNNPEMVAGVDFIDNNNEHLSCGVQRYLRCKGQDSMEIISSEHSSDYLSAEEERASLLYLTFVNSVKDAHKYQDEKNRTLDALKDQVDSSFKFEEVKNELKEMIEKEKTLVRVFEFDDILVDDGITKYYLQQMAVFEDDKKKKVVEEEEELEEEELEEEELEELEDDDDGGGGGGLKGGGLKDRDDDDDDNISIDSSEEDSEASTDDGKNKSSKIKEKVIEKGDGEEVTE